MVHKLTLKRRRSLRRTKRKINGGGYETGPGMVSPGNIDYNKYTGIGKDCIGNSTSLRPGFITDYMSKGLPGWTGGSKRRKDRKKRGGAVPNEGPITNPNMLPVNASLIQKAGWMSNPTGSGGTVAQPGTIMSMPGVPPSGTAQMPIVKSDPSPIQKGGRYGFFPEIGPLNPVNGIGVSPTPFGRIPCESGTFNPLNPDPNNIQKMSTVPLTPPFVSGRLAGGGPALSAANFPTVQVGQPDSMRYNVPTAGYRNDFMTFRAPSPVPGLTIQTPYDAKAFNQSCIKTGGSRRKRGGATSVALDAGVNTPAKLDEIWTRKDFDATDKLLPVKFGGKRKTRRNRNRKSHKKY